jgi:hypothetical protein
MARRRKHSGPTNAWGVIFDALVLMFAWGMVARGFAMTFELALRAETATSPIAAHGQAGMGPSGDGWRSRYRLSDGFRMLDTVTAQFRPRASAGGAKHALRID